MDVGDDETQWTDAAKRAYQQRADELVEVLQAHVAATLSRTGRQRELEPYGESSDTLLAAARAFDDAEFDWCGSFPLGFTVESEDDGDDLDDDVFDPPDPASQGSVLSVMWRWDFQVLEEASAVAAGRAAYRRSWPDDTDDDAVAQVPDLEHAAWELMHADGFDALKGLPSLRLKRDATTIIQHEGEDDESFDADPWAITQD